MIRRVLIILALFVVGILAYSFLHRPFLLSDPRITAKPFDTPESAQQQIQQAETKFTDLRAGTGKEIIWFDGENKKTDIAIVYVHGFSASKEELRPVPDDLAKTFKANLFYTRLAGHGRPANELGTVEVEQWLDDVVEAANVGRAIGNNVVIIGASTGASLVTWLISQPEHAKGIVAAILVSPNYGLKAFANDILRIPFAREILPAVFGPTRRFVPVSQEHEYFWTPVYPTQALVPMSKTVDLARYAPVENAKVPVLVVYSTNDKVVDGKVTKHVIEKWGAPSESLIVDTNDNPGNHVPAGRVMSPSTTAQVTQKMTQWLKKTLNK